MIYECIYTYTFKGNFLCFSYCPLPLLLPLDTTDRFGSTFPHFHHVFVALIKSLWASSSGGWTHTPPPLLTQLMLQFLSVHLPPASLHPSCTGESGHSTHRCLTSDKWQWPCSDISQLLWHLWVHAHELRSHELMSSSCSLVSSSFTARRSYPWIRISGLGYCDPCLPCNPKPAQSTKLIAPDNVLYAER